MSASVLKNLSKSLSNAETMNYTGEVWQSRRRKPNPEFVRAVCLVRDDDALLFEKKYRIRLLPTGRIAVTDETGETVICDREDFDI